MRLTISKDSEPIQINIEGPQATSCAEIQPGIRVQLDDRGNTVGVEIVPSELRWLEQTTVPANATDGTEPERINRLGEEIRALRDEMWAAGLGPLTEEEFDRELAERRG